MGFRPGDPLEARLRYTRRCVDFAARLGVKIVTFHMGLLPGLAGPKQSAAASFARTDDIAGKMGVVLRAQDAQNYYFVYRNTGGTSQLRISKVVGGTETLLKFASIGNPAKNTFFQLGGKAQGSTLTLELGGVPKLTVSDATFGSGQVGVRFGSTSNKLFRVDSFSASAE